jgi:hypothetical protein
MKFGEMTRRQRQHQGGGGKQDAAHEIGSRISLTDLASPEAVTTS